MGRWGNKKATWNTVKNQTGIQRRNFGAQVLDWPKILFEFFLITSFRKTRMNFLANPIYIYIYMHCPFIWYSPVSKEIYSLIVVLSTFKYVGH